MQTFCLKYVVGTAVMTSTWTQKIKCYSQDSCPQFQPVTATYYSAL